MPDWARWLSLNTIGPTNVVAEPTELQLVVAHKGFVWLDVETQGVAGTASRPHLGPRRHRQDGRGCWSWNDWDRS